MFIIYIILNNKNIFIIYYLFLYLFIHIFIYLFFVFILHKENLKLNCERISLQKIDSK